MTSPEFEQLRFITPEYEQVADALFEAASAAMDNNQELVFTGRTIAKDLAATLRLVDTKVISNDYYVLTRHQTDKTPINDPDWSMIIPEIHKIIPISSTEKHDIIYSSNGGLVQSSDLTISAGTNSPTLSDPVVRILEVDDINRVLSEIKDYQPVKNRENLIEKERKTKIGRAIVWLVHRL